MKQKWYFNSWLIGILFMLWPIFGVPLAIGIILLLVKGYREKKWQAENERNFAETKQSYEKKERSLQEQLLKINKQCDQLTAEKQHLVKKLEKREDEVRALKTSAGILPESCPFPEYTVFHIETTGRSTRTSEILEIGAYKIKGEYIVDTFRTFVRPMGEIDPAATRANHITYDMVKDASTVDVCLRDFAIFVGDDALVGYNSNGFDLPIIKRLAKPFGITFENRSIDALDIAKEKLPKLGRYALADVLAYYDIDRADQRRALSDCLAIWECYQKLTS